MTVEMSIPFRMDASGSIGAEIEPDIQLGNRVYALVATQPGERVMRRDFGVDSARLAFGMDADLVRTQLLLMVKRAVAKYEPQAKILNVIPDPRNQGFGFASVLLEYTRTDAPLGPVPPQIHTVEVEIGGLVKDVTGG